MFLIVAGIDSAIIAVLVSPGRYNTHRIYDGANKPPNPSPTQIAKEEIAGDVGGAPPELGALFLRGVPSGGVAQACSIQTEAVPVSER